MWKRKYLQQIDAVPRCLLTHLIWPDGHLDLADVGFSEVEHTDTGLADAAAYGVGQIRDWPMPPPTV